jgi:hypothetical protein
VEAKRRWLVIALGAVLVVAGAIGSALALSGSGPRLADASYPGYDGISFRYPAAWKHVTWCWTGTTVSPMAVFTTARHAPSCAAPQAYADGTPFPPPEALGKDGVALWWVYTDRSGLARIRPNMRIGGRPANLAGSWRRPPKSVNGGPRCEGADRQRFLLAEIQAPGSSSSRMDAGAVVCGPDYTAGEMAVKRILASTRFSS